MVTLFTRQIARMLLGCVIGLHFSVTLRYLDWRKMSKARAFKTYGDVCRYFIEDKASTPLGMTCAPATSDHAGLLVRPIVRVDPDS